MYHRRIVHLCNVKEVAPSKRLNSKVLIYIFYLFLSWFHNKLVISPKFIDIILACISNPWIAPLINGRPSRYFRSIRGLRQGCPLSPFLFILMAETLSIQLESQREKRKITSIRIAREVKEINHSLFVEL